MTPQATKATVPDQNPVRVSLNAFVAKGRLSVRVDDRIDSGAFEWERSARGERIGLFTPLGSQVAALTRDTNGRTTLTRDGETREAATVALLSAELLGVPLDLDLLAAWLQGVGLDAEGRAWHTEAGSEWIIEAALQGQRVKRLVLTRENTIVRVVIDDWRTP
jgi:outer membrane biogenesis lipoprotein LolB